MGITIFRPEMRRCTVRGVLFDMDGVILDTEKLYTRFWQEAANALGYPMTRQQALGMRSRNREAGERQLKAYLGQEVSYEAVRSKRIELMNAYITQNGVEPMPGIYDLLDALDAKGIPAAITTSSPLERVERYLKPLNLFRRFQKICTGYEVAKGKPEPDIYLYGAKSLGLKPEECLALEDSAAGIESAYRAGCLSVMIPDQDAPNEASLARLYALADSLTDIVDLV